jgi:hypothetical protein
MKGQMSFTHIEKELLPEMRKKLNLAEDTVDVGNHFKYTIINLLQKVFENEQLELDADDVAFSPKAKNYFSVSPKLLNHQAFKQTWEQSDLPNVIKRFADTSYHRYVHLNKHLEKTNLKIRKT